MLVSQASFRSNCVSESVLNDYFPDKIEQLSGEIFKRPMNKRALERPSEDETTENQELRKKNRYQRILKKLNPVTEIPQSDAYVLGESERKIKQLQEILQASSTVQIKQAEGKLTKHSSASNAYASMIEEIAEKRSERVSKQFQSLISLVSSSSSIRRENAKKLIDFALEVIQTIPEREIKEKKSFESLLSACSVSEGKKNVFEEAEEKESEETSVLLKNAEETLGLLLLAADKDIYKAIEAVNARRLDTKIKNIASIVENFLKSACDAIKEFSLIYEKVPFQKKSQGAYSKTCIEAAKLLTLSSGDINIGIQERIINGLIKKEDMHLLAYQAFKKSLSAICANPDVFQSVEDLNPPKDNRSASALAMRVFLDIKEEKTLSKNDAQVFMLSALLSYVRQANAGTCFATAVLIKLWDEQLDKVALDLADCIESGALQRQVDTIITSYPFQSKITDEGLDLTVQMHNGCIASLTAYGASKKSMISTKHTLEAIPEIKAVCLAMNIDSPPQALEEVCRNLGQEFSIKEFIDALADVAYKMQGACRPKLRSQPLFTKEELLSRGLYAFGSKQNHPLVRGYEQAAASMVSSIAFEIPHRSYWLLSEALEERIKTKNSVFKKMCKNILSSAWAPMLARMSYRYNPGFQDTKALFNDGNHGIKEYSEYGYELWDRGLPRGFSFEGEKPKNGMMIYADYKPVHQWKIVDTEEKFHAFAKDVIFFTASELAKTLPKESRRLLEDAANFMGEQVDYALTKEMTESFFLSKKEQKKAWNKNRRMMNTTPWKLRWGGYQSEVQEAFYGFKEGIFSWKSFKGSQKEVLAKCIRYIKNQPQEIFERVKTENEKIVISSPVHAFLLTPGEKSFQSVLDSAMPVNEYIDKKVIVPGEAIANKKALEEMQKQVIAYAAGNQWHRRFLEVDDFERLKLTAYSKKILKDMIESSKELFKLPVKVFEEKMMDFVFEARASDPEIKEYNKYWEKQFARWLQSEIKEMLSQNVSFSEHMAKMIIEKIYAHEDSFKFSKEAQGKFISQMESIPKNLSVKNFRKEVVKAAMASIEKTDKEQVESWKKFFSGKIDAKIFSLLSKEDKETIIQSGIITHDSNWSDGIYGCLLMFTVNPGSGNLELCKYYPDTRILDFMAQDSWFPRGEGAGSWRFPDNYRVYSEEPVFKSSWMLY